MSWTLQSSCPWTGQSWMSRLWTLSHPITSTARRYKASHEKETGKVKQQRRCKKCGNMGHYQKNCNV